MAVKLKIISTAVLLSVFPFFINAQSLGQEVDFNISPLYDSQGRQELTAVLVKTNDKLSFYADRDWWQNLSQTERQSLDVIFYNLGIEFEGKIYPDLTGTFGPEPRSGIYDDERITVLLHPMIAEAGGYFNSGDLYEKLQYPKSNERKMVYLNSRHINKAEAKAFLAHEFVHLITANQKDLLRNVVEETWLNEARAEYSATFLGYDDVYQGSNLERRTNDFLKEPKTSLTEWLNRKEDYGAVNLFIQYLVDHYGIRILVDSLQSSKVGIESINYALERNNYNEDFSDIFANWAIALLVNDCRLGERYCYSNKNLKDLRVTPIFHYLPRTETVMSSYYETTYWGLNWHRFLGGGNNFVLEFDGTDEVVFEIPYLLCNFDNNCSVKFISLDQEQKGEISFPRFNAEHSSLTVLPFIKNKTSGLNGRQETVSFSWSIIVGARTEEERKAELRDQLLAQITELKAEVGRLQARLAALMGDVEPITCDRFENNLYFGIRGSGEVRCLQEFLKAQGSDIYPEAQVTGNFLSLTQAAVIRFQEKYAEEILNPLNLQRGTGYVGEMTRAKINDLINF